MSEPAAVVRQFLTLLEDGRADAAADLLDPAVEWRNTSMPTFRGKKVAGMLRDMERRGIGFEARLHHLAADGPVVLTERTDYLRYGRWESAFWVCGTFEVRDGRIALWDDHFSMGNVVAASLKGLLRLVRR
ncbi:limonene-1,2-epoxide hydrolase family protein [Marmoricola sp. RAF53]|uniref:limonene-1,2-epoxide hydrolase family protein n=1 Tax=Marmoricola sp. RAF53 TaxID=3233059 RepID=UPI003F95FD79